MRRIRLVPLQSSRLLNTGLVSTTKELDVDASTSPFPDLYVHILQIGQEEPASIRGRANMRMSSGFFFLFTGTRLLLM